MVAGCGSMGYDRDEKPPLNVAQARLDARAALLQAAVSADPLTRSHAMEAIGETLGRQDAGMLVQGLDDPAVAVRYAAAMALGDIAYEPAKERLIQLVDNPRSDQRVVCAAIYALSRMGHTRYAGQLGTILMSELALGRSAAAMAMGRMGEQSAVGPLKTVMGDEDDPGAKMAMVEALAQLGDQRSIRSLEAYAKGYLLDLRLAAIRALGEIKPPRAKIVLNHILQSDNPPRVRVAAAGALAGMGTVDPAGYELALQALRRPRKTIRGAYGEEYPIKNVEVSSLRQLAAMALGRMGKKQAVPYLRRYLDSQDGAVRVAAAMAILEILPGPQARGGGATVSPPADRDVPRLRKMQTSDAME
jgi:HEAT repeat protein